MNALTMAELRLKHAEMFHRAEKARQQGRAVSATGQVALTLARQTRQYQIRADDYARLIEIAEAESGE